MRQGGCLCGSVRFEASRLGSFGICHCRTCQLWTGGPLMAVNVPEDAMIILSGATRIAATRTSDWASRSRCAACGSPLWYRHDRGADGTGDYEVPIGLLDDADGLILKHEIYTDLKPDCFAIAGDHPRLTEAQTIAQFGADTEGA